MRNRSKIHFTQALHIMMSTLQNVRVVYSIPKTEREFKHASRQIIQVRYDDPVNPFDTKEEAETLVASSQWPIPLWTDEHKGIFLLK